MKRPSTLIIFRSIIVFLIVASGISLLGALGYGLRWVAAWAPQTLNVKDAAAKREASGFTRSGLIAPSLAMQACALNCTATVPATGQAGVPIGFAATATA